MSFDAGMFGCRLGPVDSYRFAKGEEVTSSSGQRVRLSRPLDFLVVADHSDFMGLAPDFVGGKPEVLADPTARRWYELIHAGQGRGGLRRVAAALWRREDARDDAIPAGQPRLPLRVAGDHSGRGTGQ